MMRTLLIGVATTLALLLGAPVALNLLGLPVSGWIEIRHHRDKFAPTTLTASGTHVELARRYGNMDTVIWHGTSLQSARQQLEAVMASRPPAANHRIGNLLYHEYKPVLNESRSGCHPLLLSAVLLLIPACLLVWPSRRRAAQAPEGDRARRLARWTPLLPVGVCTVLVVVAVPTFLSLALRGPHYWFGADVSLPSRTSMHLYDEAWHINRGIVSSPHDEAPHSQRIAILPADLVVYSVYKPKADWQEHVGPPYYYERSLVVDARLMAGLLLLYPARCLVTGLFRCRRRIQARRGLCPECGYDLRGSPTGVCSECGCGEANAAPGEDVEAEA